MTELIRVRGLNRSSNVRVGKGKLSPTKTTVLDLDDGTTRRDLAHHSAIGQYVVVGGTDVAVVSGVVASAGTGLSFSVSAGSLLRNDGSTITVAGVSNSALTAADSSHPRVDLIVVDKASGAASKVDGTAAVAPVAPATPSGKLAIAEVLVATSATTSAGTTYTDVAPRL